MERVKGDAAPATGNPAGVLRPDPPNRDPLHAVGGAHRLWVGGSTHGFVPALDFARLCLAHRTRIRTLQLVKRRRLVIVATVSTTEVWFPPGPGGQDPDAVLRLAAMSGRYFNTRVDGGVVRSLWWARMREAEVSVSRDAAGWTCVKYTGTIWADARIEREIHRMERFLSASPAKKAA